MTVSFESLSNSIQSYCKKNGLDYEKAKKMSRCCGQDFLALQFYDKSKKNNGLGLLDETPLPLVLMIRKTQNGLTFEQTEYTRQYLT